MSTVTSSVRFTSTHWRSGVLRWVVHAVAGSPSKAADAVWTAPLLAAGARPGDRAVVRTAQGLVEHVRGVAAEQAHVAAERELTPRGQRQLAGHVLLLVGAGRVARVVALA